jgi:hypothetical protein
MSGLDVLCDINAPTGNFKLAAVEVPHAEW